MMNHGELLHNVAYKALWKRVLEGFKYISGRGWKDRADYPHIWALAQSLYAMAYGPHAQLPDTLKAQIGFMLMGHAGRTRKGIRNRPYFHHILMVAYLTWLLDMPEHIQKAALAHDDLEDIPKNLKVSELWVKTHLRRTIGIKALETVIHLTNKPHPEGKHAGQLAKMAVLSPADGTLKLLDRIANLYDMRMDRPDTFGPKRIQKECIKAVELVDAMPEAPRVEVQAFMAFVIAMLAKENDFDLNL